MTKSFIQATFRIVLSATLVLLHSAFALAQLGTVKGQVRDAATQEGVIGGTVRLDGTTLGTQTDVSGAFVIERVPAGSYRVVITSVGYKTTAADVVVEAGKTAQVNTLLATDAKEIGEVVVRGVRRTNTDVAMISEIKSALQVVSGVSAEQIVKSQDRDAAEVVRRIPGVSIVDGRFIQVRGLSERYNTVWLNDVNAPSAETDKKSFSFDIVPSALLDRVLVFKDPSPELPGDFAGGLVKVYLRKPALNDKQVLVSYSAGYRAGTTFGNVQSDATHGSDWLGLGANARDLADNTPTLNAASTKEQRDQVAHQLGNGFALRNQAAMPDTRFSGSYLTGANWGQTQFGSLTSLNYSNTFTRFGIARNTRDVSGAASERQADDQSTNQVRVGLIQNFTALLAGGTKLEFRNLLSQTGRNQVTTRESFDGSTNELLRRSYSVGYEGRTVYSGQLAGTHQFNEEKNNLDWVLGYGYSAKNTPDLRRLAYGVGTDADGNRQETVLTPPPGNVDLFNASRLFQKLHESTYTLNANLKHKLTLGSREVELATGTYLEYKNRDFNARLFGYAPASFAIEQSQLHQPINTIFSDGNIGANGFRLGEDINPTYRYTASNALAAGYVSANLLLTPSLRLLTGLRVEHNQQDINSAVSGQPINISYPTTNLLPSANLSYNFTEKSLLRLAYGRSLNRPEFRESAPFYYYDFDFNVLNYGALYLNPTKALRVATIENLDLRYELYPSTGELIHFGVFYKHFTDPIENVVVQTTNLSYTFANAPAAYSYGVELDVKKSLGGLGEVMNFDGFRNFTVVFNASLIKSQVTLPDGYVSWNSSRALQGQSPYVINSGLYYQSRNNNWQASVLYNVFGPRILYAGSDQYPDVVEMPRHTIDLSLTRTMTKHLSLNVGVQDLLNQRVTLVQDFNKDGNYQRDTDPALADYRRGTYTTVGLRLAL